MILTEFCERITNSPEEADELFNSDNLYIVWAKGKDTKTLDKFIEAIDEEYYRWRKEVRGAGSKNNFKLNGEGELQGYAYNIDSADIATFEKVALMPSMKYSYRFTTYNFNEIKEKEKQEIVDALSEETE